MLRTSNGRYLQVDPDTDETVKLNSNYSVFALFDDIPVNETQMMLRTHNGNYLAAETKDGGLLKANARFMRQAWCISYVPTRGAYLKPLGLSKRLNIAKKRFLFIKSKLLQS